MFGDDRLIACLRSVAGLSAPAIASALEAAVQDYGRDQPGARDDLAVLVLQVAKDRP
jgi:hypothetical protein